MTDRDDFINSSLIPGKEKKLEIKTELKAFYLVAMGRTVTGLLNFHNKLTKLIFPHSFDPISFSIYRSIAIWIISFYVCKSKDIKIILPGEVKYKFWFFHKQSF